MSTSRRGILPAAGFTLVELMIVVTVIAIVTAMAIPAVSRSRMGANEGSAVSSIKAIITANQVYETRFNSYASQLTDLSDLGIIDEVLGAADGPPGKSGYVIDYTGTRTQFELNVDPVVDGETGIRHFFADHSGIIRFREGGQATSTDTPID